MGPEKRSARGGRVTLWRVDFNISVVVTVLVKARKGYGREGGNCTVRPTHKHIADVHNAGVFDGRRWDEAAWKMRIFELKASAVVLE